MPESSAASPPIGKLVHSVALLVQVGGSKGAISHWAPGERRLTGRQRCAEKQGFAGRKPFTGPGSEVGVLLVRGTGAVCRKNGPRHRYWLCQPLSATGLQAARRPVQPSASRQRIMIGRPFCWSGTDPALHHGRDAESPPEDPRKVSGVSKSSGPGRLAGQELGHRGISSESRRSCQKSEALLASSGAGPPGRADAYQTSSSTAPMGLEQQARI